MRQNVSGDLMTSKIDLEKKKLGEEKKKLKEKLAAKEQKLKEREKKHLFNQLIGIGKLASKANIDNLEKMALLGAFIEISQKKNEQLILENWSKIAEEFLKYIDQNNAVSLSVKFPSPPDKIILDKLKELKFKWNRFRKEFYGFGNKDEVSKILSETGCIIEEIT